jgi:hypothetical protein
MYAALAAHDVGTIKKTRMSVIENITLVCKFAFVARARVASRNFESWLDLLPVIASSAPDTSHQISITDEVGTLGARSGAGMRCASSLSSGYRRKTAKVYR